MDSRAARQAASSGLRLRMQPERLRVRISEPAAGAGTSASSCPSGSPVASRQARSTAWVATVRSASGSIPDPDGGSNTRATGWPGRSGGRGGTGTSGRSSTLNLARRSGAVRLATPGRVEDSRTGSSAELSDVRSDRSASSTSARRRPRSNSRANGSSSSRSAIRKQTAAACLQGSTWSGHEQLGRTSPAPGSRSRPADATSSTTSGGSSPSSRAAVRPICAPIASRTAVHPLASKVGTTTVTVYGVGRLPCTEAITRPGATSIRMTAPRRA